jgi:hypothetical protein
MKEGRGFAFLLKNEKDCSLERMVLVGSGNFKSAS